MDESSLPNDPLIELDAYLAHELGPACLKRFLDPVLRKEFEALRTSGLPVEDVVLQLVHREAAVDRHVADEFLGHFLSALMKIGHFSMSDGLRRFLDTGDLVNSVAGSLWQELANTEFRTRREFLAYLSKRVQWKAADRARGFSAGKRRQDLQRDIDFEAGGLFDDEQAGPSTLVSGAEDKERLVLALLRLPDRDREILRRHLCGEDHAQVANALDLKPETARKALQRAIEKARAFL